MPSILTLELNYNRMLSSLPVAAATAVAHRSQRGKQGKRIPLVKCTEKKRPSRNACAAIQNSMSVRSVRTAVPSSSCVHGRVKFFLYGRASFFPVRPCHGFSLYGRVSFFHVRPCHRCVHAHSRPVFITIIISYYRNAIEKHYKNKCRPQL